MDYGLFLAKIVTVVVAIIAILIMIKAVGGKDPSAKGTLEITNLTDKHKQTIEQFESHLHDEAFLKARDKAEKKEEKDKNKERGKEIKKASKEGKLAEDRALTYLFWILKAVLMPKSFIASRRDNGHSRCG